MLQTGGFGGAPTHQRMGEQNPHLSSPQGLIAGRIKPLSRLLVASAHVKKRLAEVSRHRKWGPMTPSACPRACLPACLPALGSGAQSQASLFGGRAAGSELWFSEMGQIWEIPPAAASSPKSVLS